MATHFSDPHAAADVLIRDGEAVISEVQAKSYSRAADAARVLADEKYAGMDRLRAKGDDNKIQALIERYQQRFGLDSSRSDAYSDVADHLTDELQANGITEGRPSRGRVRCQASADRRTPTPGGGRSEGGRGRPGWWVERLRRHSRRHLLSNPSSHVLSQCETTATKAVLTTIKATASGAVRVDP